MGNIHAVGEVVQITTDEVLTWNQIYRLSAQALGVEARLVHISSDFLIACDPSLEGPLLGDKSVSVMFDNSKLKRLVPRFSRGNPVRSGCAPDRRLCAVPSGGADS